MYPILDECYNIALGWGGAFFGGVVYGGTPFCLEDINPPEPDPQSNIQNRCIVQC
jgi:hypothetical protein